MKAGDQVVVIGEKSKYKGQAGIVNAAPAVEGGAVSVKLDLEESLVNIKSDDLQVISK